MTNYYLLLLPVYTLTLTTLTLTAFNPAVTAAAAANLTVVKSVKQSKLAST